MSTLAPEHFYDALADEYDGMTQYASRLETQQQMLRHVLPAKRAVDMGCGTGVHTVALARLGVAAAGIDISAEMLAHAIKHAAHYNAAPHFQHGDFLSTPPDEFLPADLLLCLGNSLPHLEDETQLLRVLSHWRSLLAPDGRVLIQLLNYQRVLDARERIVNIRRTSESTVIRFYDFLDNALQFNILILREGEVRMAHELRSTRLMPFTSDDIRTAALESGFERIGIYSSLEFAQFDETATDCVVLLQNANS